MTRDATARSVTSPAAEPDADIACDLSIALTLREEGVVDRLKRSVVAPIERLGDGVRVTFDAGAWEAVNRYIEIESKCCPFLDLAAEQGSVSVVLTVRGRPDAQGIIDQIFRQTGPPAD
jgi:hypothetical protein